MKVTQWAKSQKNSPLGRVLSQRTQTSNNTQPHTLDACTYFKCSKVVWLLITEKKNCFLFIPVHISMVMLFSFFNTRHIIAVNFESAR